MGKKTVYFEGLNGLRCYAASLVVFHHIAQYKFWAGKETIWGDDSVFFTFIDAIGNKSVSLFFVLSGFLITYLLLKEIEQTKTVALGKFYVRRILRIWPLYYLIIFIAIFGVANLESFSHMQVVMKEHWSAVLVVHLLILPNLLRATPVQVPGANQTWSIGVEEQFYLIWPILIKWFKKRLMPFLVGFILLKVGISFLLEFSAETLDGSIGVGLDKASTIWNLLMIEQMAVGAIGALILYQQRDEWLKVIYSRTTQMISFALILAMLLVPYHHFAFKTLEAMVFTVFIMNVSLNPRSLLTIKGKAYDLLGNLSYGIYMWHTIVIAIFIEVLGIWFEDFSLSVSILLAILSYAFTLLLAYLSYQYFETPLLKLKKRFMVVKSGTSRE